MLLITGASNKRSLLAAVAKRPINLFRSSGDLCIVTLQQARSTAYKTLMHDRDSLWHRNSSTVSSPFFTSRPTEARMASPTSAWRQLPASCLRCGPDRGAVLRPSLSSRSAEPNCFLPTGHWLAIPSYVLACFYRRSILGVSSLHWPTCCEFQASLALMIKSFRHIIIGVSSNQVNLKTQFRINKPPAVPVLQPCKCDIGRKAHQWRIIIIHKALSH